MAEKTRILRGKTAGHNSGHPSANNASSVLEEAQAVTSGDRRRDYDKATPNHERIAKLWNAYLEIRKEPDAQISALDVATMMVLLKVARNCHTPKRDNFVDMAGYARCSAQIAGFEEE